MAAAAAMLAGMAVPGISATPPSYGMTQPFVANTNPYTAAPAPSASR